MGIQRAEYSAQTLCSSQRFSVRILFHHSQTRHAKSFFWNKSHLFARYSRIPVQLDRISAADVLLSHYRLSLWCISWFRTIPVKVDAHCQTFYRSCLAREFLAVVVNNGIWFVSHRIFTLIPMWQLIQSLSLISKCLTPITPVSGILICIRAIIQYLNIKRGWRLLSGSAQERLLFFYWRTHWICICTFIQLGFRANSISMWGCICIIYNRSSFKRESIV